MKPGKTSFERIVPNPKFRLLDQVREVCRLKHYSLRTEQSYVAWVKRFLLHVKKQEGQWRHPRELGGTEITEFLTHLAVMEKVGASTQNQAMNALVFLYREVMHLPVEGLSDRVRARRPVRLPVVLTKEETHRLLSGLKGTPRLMAQLLYGTGMRLMECLRLRVKDIDFAQSKIEVHDGKGMKDRVTMLPREGPLAFSCRL